MAAGEKSMAGEKNVRQRRRTVARRVVDAGPAAVFALLMATALVEDFAHEWLGIAAFMLTAAHQVLNRTW